MVSDNFQCKKSTLPPGKLFESEYVQHLKDIFANLQSNLTSSSKLTAWLATKNNFSLTFRRWRTVRIPFGRHRRTKNNESCITSRKWWSVSIGKRFCGVQESIKSHRLHIFWGFGARRFGTFQIFEYFGLSERPEKSWWLIQNSHNKSMIQRFLFRNRNIFPS